MDEATGGGGGGVGVEQNAVEDEEFAERSIEEELAVAVADAAVAEHEGAVAGTAADRVGVVGAKTHGVAVRNGGVLGG